MIVLSNGVRIFINPYMIKDIYLGIASFGFENDIGNILGVAHLLEHILISFDSSKYVANASTARSYMSFWCSSIKGRSNKLDAIKTLISWFFTGNGRIKDIFTPTKIKDHIKELENEYYFRNEIFHCMDVLTFLSDGDLYNGGRIDMINDIDTLENILYSRMHRIIGPNTIIFVKELDEETLSLLSNTFGKLPSCPLTIPCNSFSSIVGKVVMMPSPFYTVMVNVKQSLENILAIMCLYEIYHLIDYETVGDQLYITISFVKEHEYDNFLKGVSMLKFIPDEIKFNHSDDFLMNLYLCFPWIKNDIFDYIVDVNNNMLNMFKSLEDEIYTSIRYGKYISIYPNFSKSIFNKTDRQQHKIVVLDCKIDHENKDISNIINNNIYLMKKQMINNEIHIKYGDKAFIDYAILGIMYKNNKIFKSNHGINIHHQFSSDDINTILESDTFLKYSKSKPAAIYQYLILSFFVSGNSIEDILSKRESTINFCKDYKNKILFGKQLRYDIKTNSSFVCGIVKGNSISNETLTNLMWSLKKKGLIYSLEFTKLDKKIFYIFMFTIYPEDVFKIITSNKMFNRHCIVVSNKSDIEDFSSLKKDIIIKIN
ncbi:metalloprotease [White-tailed deer poxvirus]|nr:metalloprotease [White-tailed deer poxvirus]